MGRNVHADVVELRQRQVPDKTPGRATVPADAHTPVVGGDDVAAVAGVDPHAVMVGVERQERNECLEAAATVIGDGDD